MAQIRNLKDKNGNVVFPLTHERGVRDSNGVNLEDKLASLESKSYIEAWDGASTPVVANIPAGVTVSYNSTSYTGTLVASASTEGKVYLVKNGDNYDRYITSLSGSTYSWVSVGSTQMDLSGYVTDAELSQLQQEVHTLSGKNYGVYSSMSDLPEGGLPGYAYVGSQEPFVIYNYDGTSWSNSGVSVTLSSITAENVSAVNDVEATLAAVALRKTAQTLSSAEKERVWANLGLDEAIGNIEEILQEL